MPAIGDAPGAPCRTRRRRRTSTSTRHTIFSDGEQTPEALAASLAAGGVRYAALTDHDTVEGTRPLHGRAGEARHRLRAGPRADHPARRPRAAPGGLRLRSRPPGPGGHPGVDAPGTQPGCAAASPGRCARPAAAGPPTPLPAPRSAPHPTAAWRRRTPSRSSTGRRARLPARTRSSTSPTSHGSRTSSLRLKAMGSTASRRSTRSSPSEDRQALRQLARAARAARQRRDRLPRRQRRREASLPGIDMPREDWLRFRAALFAGHALTGERRRDPPGRTAGTPAATGPTGAAAPLPAALVRAAHRAARRWPPWLLFLAAFWGLILPSFEQTLLERKRETIRELTNSAWSILAAYQRDEQAGLLTREEAQARGGRAHRAAALWPAGQGLLLDPGPASRAWSCIPTART